MSASALRRSLASDADEGAAWFASPAGFGSESPFSVSDANEMDDSSASLQGNGIKMNKVGILLLVFLGMLIAGSALATERVRISCDRSLYAAGETI